MRLEGRRIALRDRTAPDVEDHLRWLGMPEWQRWDAPWEPVEPVAEGVIRQRWAAALAQPFPQPRTRLEIEHDGRHVGYVNRYWVDQATDWLELGIDLPEADVWGQGMGTEALTLWIDYLFAQLALERVGLSTWSGNQRMIHCAKKVGMQEEARIRLARRVDGQLYDAVKYGLLRREWRSR